MSKDDNKNEGKNLGIGSEIAREGYEASVVHRMTGRAVQNHQKVHQELH